VTSSTGSGFSFETVFHPETSQAYERVYKLPLEMLLEIDVDTAVTGQYIPEK
jgi:hypothetical protein